MSQLSNLGSAFYGSYASQSNSQSSHSYGFDATMSTSSRRQDSSISLATLMRKSRSRNQQNQNQKLCYLKRECNSISSSSSSSSCCNNNNSNSNSSNSSNSNSNYAPNSNDWSDDRSMLSSSKLAFQHSNQVSSDEIRWETLFKAVRQIKHTEVEILRRLAELSSKYSGKQTSKDSRPLLPKSPHLNLPPPPQSKKIEQTKPETSARKPTKTKLTPSPRKDQMFDMIQNLGKQIEALQKQNHNLHQANAEPSLNLWEEEQAFTSSKEKKKLARTIITNSKKKKRRRRG